VAAKGGFVQTTLPFRKHHVAKLAHPGLPFLNAGIGKGGIARKADEDGAGYFGLGTQSAKRR